MTHITPAFFQFFRDLTENNHADWFKAHKARYEREVKQPFEALVADLLKELARYDAAFSTQNPKHLIFRINRDVRFSKDKSPYKTNAGAVLSPGGKKDAVPGLYVQLGAAESFCGGGLYEPTPVQLYASRQEIVYHAEEFTRLVEAPAFTSIYGEIKGEALKNAPKDFKEEAQRLLILRHKQFYYLVDLPEKTATSAQLIPFLLKAYEAAAPLNAFFSRAIAGVA